MKLDNSNRRCTRIIAGILIISVLSIFIAILIGIGDRSIYKQDEFQFAYMGMSSHSEKSSLCQDAGKNKVVTVAKMNYWTPDTAVGTLQYSVYYDGELFTDSTVLPLCLQDTVDLDGDLDLDLAGWQILVWSTGGYNPVDDMTKFRVKQEKDDDVYLDVYLYVDWDEGIKLSEYDGDCRTLFTGYLDLDDSLDDLGVDGSGYVLLDSNHPPAGAVGATDPLGKDVCITFCSQWQGCHRDPQKFWLILLHLKLFKFRSPQLPVFIAS